MNVGQLVGGRYLVAHVLGRGALGSVYVARDLRLNRSVVLKTFEGVGADPEYTERLRREFSVVAGIDDPGVVRSLDLVREGDAAVLVREFVAGEALPVDKPMDVDRAIDIIVQAAHALGVIHKRGILHRDVKPSNIFITDAGRVVLADFGIASRRDSSPMTRIGTVLGTPTHMSPEQVTGDALDQRSDLYSLGVVLYQLLSGRLPFEADRPADWMIQQVLSAPTPIAQHNPAVGPALAAVVSRALAKAPAERFQSAEELITALEATATPQPGAVPTLTPATDVAAPAAPARGPSSALRAIANAVRNLLSPSSDPRSSRGTTHPSDAALARSSEERTEVQRELYPQTEYNTMELLPVHRKAPPSIEERTGLAWLLVLSGERRGQHIQLGQRTVIGRDPAADISLSDVTVSRQHAQVVLANGQFVVEELRSSNGTFLNGARLTERARLHDRDELRVGSFVLLFVEGAGPEQLGLESRQRVQEFDALWERLVNTASLRDR